MVAIEPSWEIPFCLPLKGLAFALGCGICAGTLSSAGKFGAMVFLDAYATIDPWPGDAVGCVLIALACRRVFGAQMRSWAVVAAAAAVNPYSSLMLCVLLEGAFRVSEAAPGFFGQLICTGLSPYSEMLGVSVVVLVLVTGIVFSMVALYVVSAQGIPVFAVAFGSLWVLLSCAILWIAHGRVLLRILRMLPLPEGTGDISLWVACWSLVWVPPMALWIALSWLLVRSFPAVSVEVGSSAGRSDSYGSR